MADELAVIEAPVETTPALETPEIGTESTPVETQSPETEQLDTPESDVKGPALWRDIKTAAQSGKPLTPQQLSQLNKVIHRDDAHRSKYPEGLSSLESQLSAVKQLVDDETMPIDQAIAQTVQERDYFRGLDSAYTAGKPEFVDKIAEASPEAFQNLAPSMFRKYAEMNPEGYSSYVAQAVTSHMDGANVPLNFQILRAFIPQLPESPVKQQIVEAINGIFTWSETLRNMAATKVAPKTLPNQQKEGQNPDLAKENAELKAENTRQSWNGSVRDEGITMVRTEAQKLAGKTQLSDKEHQTVLAKVAEELEIRLAGDKRYGEAMRGYLQNNNRSAYVQRMQSERKKLIPAAARRAVDDVIAARPKAAPKAADPGPKKPVGAQQQFQGATQFRRIAGPPKTIGMQVDLNKTTSGMLQKRQAYIVGQKDPVSWGMAK